MYYPLSPCSIETEGEREGIGRPIDQCGIRLSRKWGQAAFVLLHSPPPHTHTARSVKYYLRGLARDDASIRSLSITGFEQSEHSVICLLQPPQKLNRPRPCRKKSSSIYYGSLSTLITVPWVLIYIWVERKGALI